MIASRRGNQEASCDPASKLLEAASAQEEVDAISAGRHVAGFAGAIRDGKLIVEAPEAAFAGGRQAMVPVMSAPTSGSLNRR